MTTAFVLDKQTILDRLGGDEEIFAAMADMYLQDVETHCAGMDAALATGDAAVLRREVHTVKGLLATLADDEGAALAYGAEIRAREGECATLAALVSELKSRLRLVAAGVRETL